MLLEEPLRLASVLTPAKPKVFPSLTKIVGTLGPKSHSVEVIQECLTAGMSVARFDFSWMDAAYHQETLDNLRKAAQNVKKLCPVMLDTLGPEIQVHNSTGEPIELKAGNHVIITPDISKAPSAEILPIKFGDLAKAVKKGDTLFMGQYLFTGSETTSVWLEVVETSGENVNCLVKNAATLAGPIFTLHFSQVHISLPTLSEYDKQLKAFLKSHDLPDTQIYAKIENSEGLDHFDEILKEADGIIISRGDLGIDLPPENVFMFQKKAIHHCNLEGKPVIITRVVDSMIDNLRPTRAEATDVANAVLDGTDGILLGAETLRGLYPVDAVSTVGRICAEAETVYNQPLQFKKVMWHVGDPMPHEESVASAAVGSAIKVKAAAIVVFTFSGRAARLVSKYRPTMPVLAVIFPREGSDPSKWRSYGTTQARQCFAVRGVYPLMGSTDEAETGGLTKEEYGIKLALNYGRSVGIVKPFDRLIIFEKIGDSSVVKIIECEG
ncbi:Pyruvate kinase 1, cytosolic [Dichanthelium oligosanthes]|uniref:Pyruvate kinase n=1 Tax=Dichanthelium oligosanthes TaxID=888268 RepID=A0A1E5VI76_9POAL|nr:Pyruvate kinase 1, cytosolic [Dichanthelium oligosanthes]